MGADGVGFGVGMINTGVHMYAADGDDGKVKDRHVVLHVATSLGPACDPDVLMRNARRECGGGGSPRELKHIVKSDSQRCVSQ